MRLTEFYQSCPHCGGPAFSDLILAEKKDACYHKVKASAKVWPSAYASGRLVQCRKKGAANYGNKSESVTEAADNTAFRQGYEQGIRYYRRGPQNPYEPGTPEFTDYNDGYQMGEADSYDKYDTSSMDENSR